MTITSADEQGFINANLLSGWSDLYYIGGTRVNGQWHWITGEKWNYENWDYDGNDSNDLKIWGDDGLWNDGDYNREGYYCEWSYNNFLSSAVVPDVNGNGADEFAALYRPKNSSNGHTVIIKDSATKKQLSKLTFPGSSEPSPGMVVLHDMEGNGTPEIALLYGASKVQIKDVMHNLTIINNMTFLDSNYIPQAISVSPDINGNGADEITVLGVHKDTGKAKMEMRDGKTDTILRSVVF